MAILGDICKINMGQSPDSSSYNSEGKGLPFFQGNADFGKMHPKVRVWCSVPTKIAQPNDILISVRAPIGALNIANTECCIGRGLASLTVDANKCLQKYIWYALMSKVDELNSKGTGSTFKAISKNILNDTELPLPSLEEQKDIVKRLNKANDLIEFRKQQLSKLDELVKSRFIELFGTLENPAQEFKKATLKELCIKITDGKHGGCTQEEGSERYFIGAREIYDNAVHYDTAPEINLAEFEKDYKRCNVEIGDFLIVNTGATIGKSAIAVDPRTEYTLLQKSVALLKTKRELLNPVFLQYCYKVNEKMYKVESASAQPNLLLSKINSTEIYVPHLDLQNQFVAFVEQTDKSKLAIQQSLEQLETLKKSLMQQYFG